MAKPHTKHLNSFTPGPQHAPSCAHGSCGRRHGFASFYDPQTAEHAASCRHGKPPTREPTKRKECGYAVSWENNCISAHLSSRRNLTGKLFFAWPWTTSSSSLAPLGGVPTEAIIPLRWRKRVWATEHLTGWVVRYGWERSVRGLCLSSVSGVLTQDGWGFFSSLAMRPEK